MTQHIHPQRESYPLVTSNDELVMVFRDHIPDSMRPVLYVKSLVSAEWRVDSSRTLDSRAGFVVVDFTNGTTDTVTLTVNGGAPTVLTEGSEFDATISNDNTALEIAGAINTAAVGLTATAEGNKVFVLPDPGTVTFTLDSGDDTAWEHDSLALVGSVTTQSQSGLTAEIELPVGTDPTKAVSFLRVLKGRVSVELRSPVEVRSYFRQPLALAPNTGHPGGWPVAPDPPLP